MRSKFKKMILSLLIMNPIISANGTQENCFDTNLDWRKASLCITNKYQDLSVSLKKKCSIKRNEMLKVLVNPKRLIPFNSLPSYKRVREAIKLFDGRVKENLSDIKNNIFYITKYINEHPSIDTITEPPFSYESDPSIRKIMELFKTQKTMSKIDFLKNQEFSLKLNIESLENICSSKLTS